MNAGADHQQLVLSLQDEVTRQREYIAQLESMVLLQMALRKVETKNNERRIGAKQLESSHG